jgi:polar amino acid transport system substrate-binding protein
MAQYDRETRRQVMYLSRLVIGVAAILVTGSMAVAKDWTTVRIGTEGAYPPFNYVDSKNELQGFDIDIAKALCEKMGVECKLVVQDWDGIIPALTAGKYDAIIASMSITDERKQVVNFTDRYYTNKLHFVAGKDAGLTEVTPEALDGKSLGAQSSTVSAVFLEENYGNASSIKLYPTQEEAYLDLASGRIDAVLADFGPSELWLRGDAGSCCAFVGEAVFSEDEIGIAVRQDDDDLREMFNKALAEIIADGTYQKINEKYFPFSVY